MLGKGGDISQKHAQDAIRDAALDYSFDPVREYLLGVRDNPDIEPADITQLSTHFLGVADELSNRQLAAFAIGAVRRVFKPGCKHDTCLVLHSEEQGKGKSTFWNELASDPFFNDTGQSNDKDFLLATHQCWLYAGSMSWQRSRRSPATRPSVPYELCCLLRWTFSGRHMPQQWRSIGVEGFSLARLTKPTFFAIPTALGAGMSSRCPVGIRSH